MEVFFSFIIIFFPFVKHSKIHMSRIVLEITRLSIENNVEVALRLKEMINLNDFFFMGLVKGDVPAIYVAHNPVFDFIISKGKNQGLNIKRGSRKGFYQIFDPMLCCKSILQIFLQNNIYIVIQKEINPNIEYFKLQGQWHPSSYF